MRRLLPAIIVIMLLVGNLISFVYAAQSGEIFVYLDGVAVEFDVKPQAINGRTMVPIRAIFERMGANVEWDAATNTAVCTKGDTVVKMTVGSTSMYIDDQHRSMDVAPIAINGRTLAPIRYVAEAFGADVQWSAENNTVVIGSKDVYAYKDYPDIPDLGRCYNIPLLNEAIQNNCKLLSYTYSDMANDDYYSYLYDHSALVLGEYVEASVSNADGVVTIAYTKRNETVPRYLVKAKCSEDGSIIFVVMIPMETETALEPKVTLYALDGRTLDVLENEVPAYLNVGWYRTIEETKQTLYAGDGRTTTVYKAEVPAYKNSGWYETKSDAQAANKAVNNRNPSNSYNPTPDGYYYRTPTGKRYHLDPNCGGKNSYRTKNISGLSPCQKCAR